MPRAVSNHGGKQHTRGHPSRRPPPNPPPRAGEGREGAPQDEVCVLGRTTLLPAWALRPTGRMARRVLRRAQRLPYFPVRMNSRIWSESWLSAVLIE
jgi:hypothetical protein